MYTGESYTQYAYDKITGKCSSVFRRGSLGCILNYLFLPHVHHKLCHAFQHSRRPILTLSICDARGSQLMPQPGMESKNQTTNLTEKHLTAASADTPGTHYFHIHYNLTESHEDERSLRDGIGSWSFDAQKLWFCSPCDVLIGHLDINALSSMILCCFGTRWANYWRNVEGGFYVLSCGEAALRRSFHKGISWPCQAS